jgi:di/tricarboxylate transporter
MPGFQSILVLAVVIVAMAFFIAGRHRVDLIALCVLAALVIAELIDSHEALAGFASPATATIAAMFVISEGLVRTGLVQWVSHRLDRVAGKKESGLILVLCLVVAVLSAFLVNTAVVAIFLPVAIVLGKNRKISASRILIPLSFASQFGGVSTLIGTSTNILVSSIAVKNGMEAFSFFEFTPLGMILTAVGTTYLLITSRWLLPKRRPEVQEVDIYRLADYLAEFRVTEKSPLINQAWEQSDAAKVKDVDLIKLIRKDRTTWRPGKTKIREGDVLLLHGHVEKLMSMKDTYGLEFMADAKMEDRDLSSDDVKLIEVLIHPESKMLGRTPESAGLCRRYGCFVLAIQRRGKAIRERLSDILLDEGDTLLLQVGKEDLPRFLHSRDLIVTNELTELYVRKDRAVVALAMLLSVVGLVVLDIVPVVAAALFGAVGMVIGRCLTIDEAYNAIDWKIIFLLGGIIPLGVALEQTGTATLIADTVLRPFITIGPIAVLAVFYFVTALLTEGISNNASAVILAPFALSVAGTLEVDPRPFLVAITFAASTSFATPVGYQTNTMVYAPGGYRFLDYTKIGMPLNLIFWGLSVVLIPIFWPFYV